jgi:hypothetical protein
VATTMTSYGSLILHVKRACACPHNTLEALQSCDENFTIGELKRQLSALESVPADQIVLFHAGVELSDDIVPLTSGMSRYNGAMEIFLDLQVSARPPSQRAIHVLCLTCTSTSRLQ